MLTEFQDANNGQAIYCAPQRLRIVDEAAAPMGDNGQRQ